MSCDMLQAYLVPAPQRMRRQRGGYDLARLRTCVCEGCTQSEESAYLLDELHDVLGRRLMRTQRTVPNSVTLRVDGVGVRGKGAESYALAIGPDGITITGASTRAVFWGVQTLWQLRSTYGLRLPCITIEDWPHFGWRGFSDDMSRRQISPLRDLVFTMRWLARFKINLYQPYIEDIIYLDKHPLVGRKSGRFTRDEVAQLVAAGRRYFVDIMPQFNSLSHQEHLLALPEYHAWRFEGNPETLDPRLPAVRAYLRDVYEQLFEQFPCKYFHMGLDEARGLVHRPDLFINMTNWLADMVVAAGKIPVIWHDMFVPYDRRAVKYSPALLQQLHPAVILNVWLYRMPDARAAFLEEAARQDRQIVVSPWIQSHLCGAARADAESARLLVRYAQRLPGMLGVHNTTWNDNAIVTDRALNWRGHAMAAALGWRGARSLHELETAARGCAVHMHGLRAPADLAALDAAAECGAQASTRGRGAALSLPVRLAHTVTQTDVASAGELGIRVRGIHARIARVSASAAQHADLLDHVLLGLRRVEVGAVRMQRAQQLQRALQHDDVKRIAALAAQDVKLLHALRAHHAAVYLHRYKAEGLEYLEYYYRSCIAALEDLAWQVEQHRKRHHALCAQGFLPLDLAGVVTSPPRELAALLYGPVVHDNVPWLLLDPATCSGHSLIWTGSSQWKDYPREVHVPVQRAARELHVLHGAYGAHDKPPGSYCLHFADGSEHPIRLRARKDCGDWWMPFGHTFGGGGALRLDPRHCRLACLTDPEFMQGHCLYHFYLPIRARSPVSHITIQSGHPDVSLIVAAITLCS